MNLLNCSAVFRTHGNVRLLQYEMKYIHIEIFYERFNLRKSMKKTKVNSRPTLKNSVFFFVIQCFV